MKIHPDNMPPDVAGTENEFGVGAANAFADRDIRRNLPEWLVCVNTFLSNGGRAYKDHGHIEYATPECTNLLQLAHAERAGQLIVSHVASGLRREAANHTRGAYGNIVVPDEPLRVCVVDDVGNARGYHINSMIDRLHFSRGGYDVFLASHFATRAIETGAGWLRPRPEHMEYVYGPSQKMASIVDFKGDDTLYRKTLINTRSESFLGGTFGVPWRRQHDITADPNVTISATFKKLTQQALVLRLALWDGVNTEGFALRNPVATGQEVARTQLLEEPSTKLFYPSHVPIQLDNGSTTDALGVRRALAYEVRRMVDSEDVPVTDEMLQGLSMWERDLDAATQGDYGVYEWARKGMFAAQFMTRQQAAGRVHDVDTYHAAVRRFTQKWDCLTFPESTPEASVAPHTVGEKLIFPAGDPLYDHELFVHMAYGPPEDTRASIRAALIRGSATCPVSSIDWHIVHSGNQAYALDHPLSTNVSPQ